MNLEGLIGRWSFERIVSGQGRMTGTATFAPRPDGLLAYCEAGQLQIKAGTFAFTRSYLYRLRPAGLDIFFDEVPMRLFQSVDLTETPTGLTGTGQHFCAPDTYQSTYAFTLPTAFAIVHTVTGPRKSYVSHTLFKRQG